MSTEPDSVAGGQLRSSAGSKTTDPRRGNNDQRTLSPLNSSWIRRLYVNSPVPPPPPPRTQTISSDESRAPQRLNLDLRSPLTRVERRSEEEVAGFGPFQFKATDRKSARQFPLVEKIEGPDSEQKVSQRDEGFKISPFFRFLPPLPNSQLTLPNLSPGNFSTNNDGISSHGEATDHSANPTERASNYRNKKEEPFSYWNLGRFNQMKNNTSSSSQIPLGNISQRKRNPITNLFFPSKFRRSGAGSKSCAQSCYKE